VQIDVEGPFPVAVGDVYLLCSDGLSGQVKDEELGMIMASLPPKEAVRALVDLANLRGGPDNITVAVAKVTGPQIASQGAAGQMPPAADNDERGGFTWSWLWWIAGGLLTAGTAVAALAGQRELALVLASGLVLMLGVRLLLSLSRTRRGPETTRQKPGRTRHGPYVAVTAAPSAAFVEHLANEYQQLRDAATNKDWDVDWSRVLSYGRSASEAAEGRDYASAVQNYCRAISFMMTELRAQQRRKKAPGRPDDSMF
jgi:protein phosphatase